LHPQPKFAYRIYVVSSPFACNGALSLKLAVFGYAWGAGGRLDGYMQKAVEAYLDLGFDVDVYLANYFAGKDATVGFKGPLLLDRLVRHVREQDYFAAVSMNNALVMAPIVEALDGRVTSVIVDGFNHLFRYGDDRLSAFHLPAHFAPIGAQFERDILNAVPEAVDRVTFLTPATAGMHFPRENFEPLYPISWIASLPLDGRAEALMNAVMGDPRAHEVVWSCMLAIEETGDLSGVMSAHHDVILSVVNQLGLGLQAFEMVLQDIATSRERVDVVNRLAPHRLSLFGNPAWSKSMVMSAGVFQAYRPGPPVHAHEELLAVYNSSKLSINLPQSFISESFQYRLLDVMSSNALLLTRRTPNPDLFRVFGPDCPVVMFDSLDDLERVCVHYLAHEDERLALVAACNSLVTDDFSFRRRALDYLRLAGVDYTPPPSPLPRGKGQIVIDETLA